MFGCHQGLGSNGGKSIVPSLRVVTGQKSIVPSLRVVTGQKYRPSALEFEVRRYQPGLKCGQPYYYYS